MNKFILLFCSLIWMPNLFYAQGKPIPAFKKTPPVTKAQNITFSNLSREQVPPAPQSIFDEVQFSGKSLSIEAVSKSRAKSLLVIKDSLTGTPYLIEGQLPAKEERTGSSIAELSLHYLHMLQPVLGMTLAEDQFEIIGHHQDKVNKHHIRLQQVFHGIKVYGAEILLHLKDQQFYLFNGRFFPSPEIDDLQPSLDKLTAEKLTKDDITSKTRFFTLDKQQLDWVMHEQFRSELVIYHPKAQADLERLAWHVSVIPNLIERWEYFIDAHTGAILHRFSTTCSFYHDPGKPHQCSGANMKIPLRSAEFAIAASRMGKTTAQATDLKGITRTIHVYECGGTFYTIDASRDMFSGDESDCTNADRLLVGVILTLDAFNTSPATGNFNYDLASSANNVWTNPTIVSAHYNGGLVYDYFLNTFGWNSINGQKGNVYAFVNVADDNGDDMDNAFWNGAAMFYGNGNTAFNAPLAKADDVAGHEIGHGVIQNTANLEYQNESGALNESFADIYGALIDRADWKIGEDIVNPAVFPTGTMRDMEDPNNGGNSYGDIGWQPKHMNEFVNLPNTPQGDNGGVHVNSGIPNHAFYLFANNPDIGKSKAEQIYHKALTDYLVRSARFVDLRNGVLQAAADLHGANSTEVNAAAAAFDAVGIGGGTPSNTQVDVELNPGQDFILWSDDNLSNINNADDTGASAGNFSGNDHISKPSVSDDGQFIQYVGADKNLWEIQVDWSAPGVVSEQIIQSSLDWRNVAVSKDGLKIAAVTGDLDNGVFDNQIFVFDFVSGESKWFELFNPTTSQGVVTGDVLFADVLEWDHSGQYIMYDAANEIESISGENISYWDIGFIHVWDNASNDFAAGQIEKLFNGLPENTSVGNPTFSKNSPFIIAFDFIESGFFGEEYAVLGANIETGEVNTIFEGNDLGYPNYSREDDVVIFHFLQNGTQDIIAIRSVASDKITGTGDALVFIEDAIWGVWFATGERDLSVSSREPAAPFSDLKLYPNPSNGPLYLQFSAAKTTEIEIKIKDVNGRIVFENQQHITKGNNMIRLQPNILSQGTFFVSLKAENGLINRKFIYIK